MRQPYIESATALSDCRIIMLFDHYTLDLFLSCLYHDTYIPLYFLDVLFY